MDFIPGPKGNTGLLESAADFLSGVFPTLFGGTKVSIVENNQLQKSPIQGILPGLSEVLDRIFTSLSNPVLLVLTLPVLPIYFFAVLIGGTCLLVGSALKALALRVDEAAQENHRRVQLLLSE